jgi:hypothetical protein
VQKETRPVIQLAVVDAKNPSAFYDVLIQRVGDATQYELDQSRVTAAAIDWVIVPVSVEAITNVLWLIWEVWKERKKVDPRTRVYLRIGRNDAWIDSEDRKIISKLADDFMKRGFSEQDRKEFQLLS